MWLAVLAALVVMFGYGLSAVAQETEQSEDELIAEAMERSFEEEITVTGSLIPRADLTALSPVTVMEVPQELTYSGIVRIEDLVVSLPQVWAGQNSTIANGATGTATINLRHLGTARTLVLINGRRLAPGDATGTWAPDINVIPSAIVKRVDVLTGGASTTYGSDAVAGVVNFVMDTDFEGVRGGVQYSGYQHDNNNMVAREINLDRGFDVPMGSTTDGKAWNANVAIGGKFADGKGHAAAYITYRNIDAVLKGDRDYVNCAVNAGSDGPGCGGSSTVPMGRFVPFDADGARIGDYVLHWASEGGDGHSFRPRTGDVYNYAPWNHLQRPDEKWNAGTFAHYTINDHFEPYIEAMFMTNFTDAQIAPSGNFNRVTAINCDNPMLSEQQWNIVCGPGTGYGPEDVAFSWILRRNVEGGNRTNQIGHDNYRLVAGMRGDINDEWSYDLYYLNAQNNQFESYINDLNVGRIANALDVIGDRDDPSTWACRSGGDCVPWNIFQEGAVTPEAVAYISTNAVMYGRTKTQVANLTFTSDWENYGIMVPSASEGIQVAVGGEYRKQWLRNVPDEVYEFGLRAGSGGRTPAVDGEYSVAELFFEALVPIIQDVKLVRDLSLELGYRYSDYKDTGNFNTWKVQASWAPSESLRFRGGYNKAVRAANIWELLRPQGFGLGGSADICAGPTPSATLEQCQRTGVTPSQYGNIFGNPADQYNTLAGGNPDLIPETADTVTAGVVWTPQNIAGLSITLDYYNIDITEAIGTLGADDIIQTCATTGDPQLCSLIHRDPQGTLWATNAGYTETTNQNIGQLVAEGVDLNAAYMIGLGNAGYLPIDLTGTYMMQNRFANPLTDYDCVGYYGFQCGQPDSVWRHKLRGTWETKFNLNVSLNWRYLHGAEIDDASPNPAIGNPNEMDKWIINGSDKTKAYNWIDLAASYTFKGGVRLTAGVNNIFDEEPPLMPGLADEMNMYASFDPLGRYFFLGMQFDF
jgi:outer membrane receptor protein involved in Fe transport